MKLQSNCKNWDQYVNPKRVLMINVNEDILCMCLEIGVEDQVELEYESMEKLKQDRDEIMSHWKDSK